MRFTYFTEGRYAYLLNDERVCKVRKLSILYYRTHFDGSFEIQNQTIRSNSLRVYWCKCLSLLQLAIMINFFSIVVLASHILIHFILVSSRRSHTGVFHISESLLASSMTV